MPRTSIADKPARERVRGDVVEREAVSHDDPLLRWRGGLCHRCEWRARYYETGTGPRMECHDNGAASPALDRKGPPTVWSCYMYKPVIPAVMSVNAGDSRGHTSPTMLRARSHRDGHAAALVETVCHDSGRKGGQHFLYLVPRSLLPEMQKMWVRMARRAARKKVSK